MNELGIFLNAKELSRTLGISRSGLFQLVRRGELPAGVKLGHSRRWQVSEVRDWLQAQAKTQKGEMRA